MREARVSHGFKVGVGTVSTSALYERLLQRDLTGLNVRARARAWPTWSEVEWQIRSTFPPDLEEQVVEQSRPKYVDADELCARLSLKGPLARASRAPRRAAPDDEAAAGPAQRSRLPTTPGEIGLSHERLRATYRRAQMIRPRYTLLDLLNEAGLLDECVAELFSDGGFWT
jgi:glycerol-1-phosphate dehydrogenase [NAD(P)+]